MILIFDISQQSRYTKICQIFITIHKSPHSRSLSILLQDRTKNYPKMQAHVIKAESKRK